jgi:hypothetical protein
MSMRLHASRRIARVGISPLCIGTWAEPNRETVSKRKLRVSKNDTSASESINYLTPAFYFLMGSMHIHICRRLDG